MKAGRYILAAAAALLLFALPAGAAPAKVTLVLQGTHPPELDRHEGSFTAPAPLCPSGTWQGNGKGQRVFTCADGSGSFTARFDGEQEHRTGVGGPWWITAGTDRYATLRGTGSASNVLLGGDPITFTNAGKQASRPAPRLSVRRRSSDDSSGYLFISPKQESTAPQGPEIVDDRGRPVWFHPTPNGAHADDFRVQRYRGEPVLTWWQGSGFVSSARGVDYVVDSSYRVIATVHAGNGLDADGHEFVLTPQGTALITIYHDVPYDLSSLGGSKDSEVVEGVVQEIDVGTGRVLFEWHSLDHVPLDETYVPGTPYDYFHINAVNLDADGNLLISGRHTWTVYKVDRHTGQILWRLGGKRSDFKLGPGVRFAWQHNPLPAAENTIRLFDNENDGSDRVMPHSRVVWIQLDTSAKTATLLKAFAHPDGLSAQSQGNAQALDNGNTFVGWGQVGRVSEFDPRGNLLFDATLPGSYDTYRAYRQEWAGHPDTRPRVIARTNANGTSTVHAVWNGATEIAAWRILAGPAPNRLVPVRTVRWNGFDTTVKIRGVLREVEVVALDVHGRVIGTSKPVRAA